MVFAWLLTIAGSRTGRWPGCAACRSRRLRISALLLLLAGTCLAIYSLSRRHRITHANVTDSHEVLVLAAAAPTTLYSDHPQLEALPKPKKKKKAKMPKLKSAA